MTTLSDANQALLDKKLFGTIATVTASGAPLQALVWYMLEGDDILVTTSANSAKARNIRARGWASLSVSEGPRYISVRGHATVESDPVVAQEERRRIIERYVEPDQVEGWLARTGGEDNVIIHLHAEHVTGMA